MQGMRVAAALLLSAVALAACTGPPTHPATTNPAPAPVYRILPPVDVPVASSGDGKLIDNALYLPAVPNGTPVPVYIIFSPYWGDSAMNEGRDSAGEFSHWFIHAFVPRGYAVVLSAIRGTGHSEGCFQLGGDQELKDSYDVVEHFGTQAWSNGNVGAGGKSYRATTQNGLIAKYPPPHLKTLFDVEGITDMYRYNGKDGVTYENGLAFNGYYYAGQSLDEYGLAPGVVGAGQASPMDESPASLARLADKAGCTTLPAEQSSGAGTAASGMKDAYWQERDWIHFLPQSTWKGSILYEEGFQDWNVKPDNMDPFLQEAQANGIAVKGWLHQWTEGAHGGHVYPMRADFNDTLVRWLDHYLKGVPNGIDSELGYDLEGTDGVWRHSATWPPAATHSTVAPMDGVLVAPRAQAVRIAGTPTATVTATGNTTDPVIRATLWVKNGTALKWANEAVRRVDLSDDLTQLVPYAPGSPIHRNVTFYPMDLVLQPGESLVVKLGISPADVAGDPVNGNPGAQTPPNFVFTPAQAQVSYQSVAVAIPLAAMNTTLSPQPIPMSCWQC
ncbi:MAG: CocE/NonD family hydrolase [Thermoplasmatota archaeon]